MKIEIKIELDPATDQIQTVLERLKALTLNASVEPKSARQRKATPEPKAPEVPEAPDTPATPEVPKAPDTPATPTAPKVSLQDLRTLLSSRVADHKSEIKAKLTEMGAGNLTTLGTDKYEEMYNYLKALS